MSIALLVRAGDLEPKVHFMDTQGAIQLLPEPYAKALTLKGQGLSAEEIAEVLGIAKESVDPCLKLAEAKLANLLTDQTIDLTDGDLKDETSERARAGSDE